MNHYKWQQWHKFQLSKNNSRGSGGGQHMFQSYITSFWVWNVVLRDLRKREKKRDLAENRQNRCLLTYVETKPNPFQAFGFIKGETNNSLFKIDLPLWLISCCTDPAWNSHIRYFLSKQPILFFKYMDGLESLLIQWTSNIHLEFFCPWKRQLLKNKRAQSSKWQPFRHLT